MNLSIAPTLLAIVTAASHDMQLVSAKELAPSPNCESSHPFSYNSGMTHTATTVVQSLGAPWIELDLTSTDLSPNAKLTLTSSNGVIQVLDAVGLANSNGYSAVFDGDSVTVELTHSAGGLFRGSSQGQPSRVVVSAVKVGLCKPADESLCGADDRTPSTDPRQGRIGGCTGWLIGEDVFLQAGHCNSPSSSSKIHFTYGTGNAEPEDQYAVEDFSYFGVNGGVGNDWGVGRLLPNSVTGLKAGVAQGGWYTLGAVPSSTSGNNIRITGYGIADVDSKSQKTHMDALTSISTRTLRYIPDTTGGNSGSPVIHEETGHAIGIHTHGGCESGGNYGTRIDIPELQDKINWTTKTCTSNADCDDGYCPNGQETCNNGRCNYGLPEQCSGPCTGNSFTVDITTDEYPAETSWILTNTVTNTQVDAKAQGWYNMQNTEYPTLTYCDDDNDDFSFTISDQYNDGMCCGYGSGSYTIKYNGLVVASGGSFATSETKTFSGGDTSSSSPSKSPTSSPTAPTNSPTRGPTESPVPPTPLPSKAPSTSPTTSSPTVSPTKAPSVSPSTAAPSTSPTLRPTSSPTPFSCSIFGSADCRNNDLCSWSGGSCIDAPTSGNCGTVPKDGDCTANNECSSCDCNTGKGKCK